MDISLLYTDTCIGRRPIDGIVKVLNSETLSCLHSVQNVMTDDTPRRDKNRAGMRVFFALRIAATQIGPDFPGRMTATAIFGELGLQY